MENEFYISVFYTSKNLVGFVEGTKKIVCEVSVNKPRQLIFFCIDYILYRLGFCRFCAKCVDKYSGLSEPTCPMCRAAFCPSQRVDDKAFKKELHKLKGKCFGCSKVVSFITDISVHFQQAELNFSLNQTFINKQLMFLNQ